VLNGNRVANSFTYVYNECCTH